jgi:hypothetical protein
VTTKSLIAQGSAKQMLATEVEGNDSSCSGTKPNLISPEQASPADYSLGSPKSRAIARAWADAKNPRNSEDRQRDDDAILLYSMAFELNGRTHPDWSTFSATSIAARGKELRDNIYGPIVPLHEDPTYSRRTDASGEFQRCFYREPRAGDLLRWEHVRTMRGPEMQASELLPQIEAWHRQLPDLPCPIKVLDGQVFKRARDGSWFEDNSPTWFDYWDRVEDEANAAREDASLQLASDSDVLGVTFLGLVNGKHRCRPATEEELRQPETDEFFREIWCTEPQAAPPPGHVWLRNRRNGFYGTAAVEDLGLLTEGPHALYAWYHWPTAKKTVTATETS